MKLTSVEKTQFYKSSRMYYLVDYETQVYLNLRSIFFKHTCGTMYKIFTCELIPL